MQLTTIKIHMDRGAEQRLSMAPMTTEVLRYLKPNFPVLAYIQFGGVFKSYIKNASVEVVSEEEKTQQNQMKLVFLMSFSDFFFFFLTKKLIRISHLVRNKFIIISFPYRNFSLEVVASVLPYFYNFLITQMAVLDPVLLLRITLTFFLVFLYNFLNRPLINKPLKVNHNCSSAFYSQGVTE